jgi:hypothetical protein
MGPWGKKDPKAEQKAFRSGKRTSAKAAAAHAETARRKAEWAAMKRAAKKK